MTEKQQKTLFFFPMARMFLEGARYRPSQNFSLSLRDCPSMSRAPIIVRCVNEANRFHLRYLLQRLGIEFTAIIHGDIALSQVARYDKLYMSGEYFSSKASLGMHAALEQ